MDNLCQRDRNYAAVVSEIWEHDLSWDYAVPFVASNPLRHCREILDRDRRTMGKRWCETGSTSCFTSLNR